MDECELITDDSIGEIGRRCTGLKRLSVSGCRTISDIGIMVTVALLRSISPQYLSIHRASSSHAPSAALLLLRYNKLIVSNSVFAHPLPCLLSRPQQEVAKHCHGLEQLFTGGCDLISDHCVRAIKDLCPSMNSSSISNKFY